jgi:4-hydroxy-3-polyprenylbenzoate decarboxylase
MTSLINETGNFMKLIIGISGASGVVMGYRLLQALQRIEDCETHLVMSEGAICNFAYETDIDYREVMAAADYCHDNNNMAACISSGSFKTDGMIVMPCSMKSLSAIATGMDINLLIRAADVCLKESRRVVLVPREMPLARSHIKNLLAASEAGCVIMPPVLTFYNNSPTLEQQMSHVIGKVLMQFGLVLPEFRSWQGVNDFSV